MLFLASSETTPSQVNKSFFNTGWDKDSRTIQLSCTWSCSFDNSISKSLIQSILWEIGATVITGKLSSMFFSLLSIIITHLQKCSFRKFSLSASGILINPSLIFHIWPYSKNLPSIISILLEYVIGCFIVGMLKLFLSSLLNVCIHS